VRRERTERYERNRVFTGVTASRTSKRPARTGCNPLSTHDDVSAALDTHESITSYAVRGVDDEEYYDAMHACIAHDPTITVDDGMDMVKLVHEEYPDLIDSIIGGAEETTTGVHRLRAMDADGELHYPSSP